MSDNHTKLIVAAIDFGTTYSGYAYSLKNDYENNHLQIYTNSWLDETNFTTYKTPTVILFEPDGKFNSFGYEAESNYAKLVTDDQQEGWRYFKRFKMELFSPHKKLTRTKKLTYGKNGKQTMLAIDVFAAAIEYLKGHLLEQLNNQRVILIEKDFHWIITVPAIWKDEAKQFMQEAALKAGIPSNQLELALEPEAAAIYCKEIYFAKGEGNGRTSELHAFKKGDQFIVLDLGGGTIDITAHEVQDDGCLKELCSPTGGPWGGTLVDKHIYETFNEMFGETVINKFKGSFESEVLDLERSLELKKRTVKSKDIGTSKINISLPNILFKTFEEMNPRKTFESSLSQSPFATSVRIQRDKLHIDAAVFQKCFEESKTQLIKAVDGLLNDPALKNTNIIMMVGGFSSSDIMQAAIKNKYEGAKSVIIPEGTEVAVLKGAVMFGFGNCITSRILAYTYGISEAIPFDPKIHPEKHKITRTKHQREITLCEDVFKVFMKKGATVVPNKTKIAHQFNALYGESAIEIYRSENKDPKFITDDGCKNIGKIELKLKSEIPGSAKNRLVEVIMWFGDTQLHVEAIEQATNNKISAEFNLL